MVCKLTASNSPQRHSAGVSLTEFMIGLGVGSLVLAATCAFSLMSSRSFVSYVTEAGLDKQNRYTMDVLNKDLRSVINITNVASDKDMTFVNWDNTLIRYVYDATNQTFSRIKGTQTDVLLKDCNRFSMSLDMRNMTNSTFWFYGATNTTEAKAVTFSWCCSRKVLGKTSDSMPQYTTVVMRGKN